MTVATGALIGLAGAVAFAGSANAHSGELTATTSCGVSSWLVHWKLTTTGTDGADGVISDVTFTHDLPHQLPGQTPQPATLVTFVENATLTGDGVFTEDQEFGSYIRTAGLQFTITWHDGDDTHTADLGANVFAPTDCPVVTVTPPTLVPGTLPPDPADSGSHTTSPTTTPPGTPDSATPTTSPATTTSPAPAPGTPTASPSKTTSPAAAPVLVSAGGGGLARTGAAVGALTGGAVLLLAVGTVLLISARRRKAEFTA